MEKGEKYLKNWLNKLYLCIEIMKDIVDYLNGWNKNVFCLLIFWLDFK